MASILVVLGYLLGSIPFALIVTRWRRGVDVRRLGSGNPGAANVWRSTGPALGLSVLVLDCAKGAAPVMIAWGAGFSVPVQALAGLAAIAGHVWPVWLTFRGGKGVATSAGVFSVLMPGAMAVATLVFGITVALTRYVSLGSLLGAWALALAAAALRLPWTLIGAAAAAATVVTFRHRENIARLLRGTELRVGGADIRGDRAR
jgi:glycerol-3-phosphate acyltransferase PlsY